MILLGIMAGAFIALGGATSSTDISPSSFGSTSISALPPSSNSTSSPSTLTIGSSISSNSL